MHLQYLEGLNLDSKKPNVSVADKLERGPIKAVRFSLDADLICSHGIKYSKMVQCLYP